MAAVIRRADLPLWFAAAFVGAAAIAIAFAYVGPLRTETARGAVQQTATVVHLAPGEQVTIIADGPVPTYSGAACSVTPDGLVKATGLTPGVKYGVWWEVIRANDTIQASGNLLPARADGTLTLPLDDSYHGYWEIYVRSETQPNYSETEYTTKCDWSN